MCYKKVDLTTLDQSVLAVEPQNSGTEHNSNSNTYIGINCSVKFNNKCSPNNDIEVIPKACCNGFNSIILRYNAKSCKFQLDIFPSDEVVNFVTKRMHDSVTPKIQLLQDKF